MTIRQFWHTTGGAPVLSGTVGAMIGLLDAVLLTGYGLKTLTSLTRSGNTATATIDAGHGFLATDLIRIEGANETAYNGDQAITVLNSTQFSFTVSGDPATPATGTITAKVPPLTGWTKPFTGTNKAAYRQPEVGVNGLYLRVDDTATLNAMVRGHETMTDVDTGEGLFPTTAQVGLTVGINWRKSEVANSTARPWVVFSDGVIFYLFAAWSDNASYRDHWSPYCFGDIVSFKAGDAYHTLLAGIAAASPSYPGHSSGFAGIATDSSSYTSGVYMARSHTQLGSAINPYRRGGLYGLTYMGQGIIAYPSPVDNGLYAVPVYVMDATSTVLRGLLPGLFAPLQNLGNAGFVTGDSIANLEGLPGRTVRVVTIANESTRYACLVDITGPWR